MENNKDTKKKTIEEFKKEMNIDFNSDEVKAEILKLKEQKKNNKK